jgi:hypothetical protein
MPAGSRANPHGHRPEAPEEVRVDAHGASHHLDVHVTPQDLLPQHTQLQVRQTLAYAPVDTSTIGQVRAPIELTTMMLATLFDFPWEDRRLLTYWSDVAVADATVLRCVVWRGGSMRRKLPYTPPGTSAIRVPPCA